MGKAADASGAQWVTAPLTHVSTGGNFVKARGNCQAFVGFDARSVPE